MPAALPGTGLTRPAAAATDAARAAFFRAALGQVQATPAPALTEAPADRAAPAGSARVEPSPDRPGRPGALLDIRV